MKVVQFIVNRQTLVLDFISKTTNKFLPSLLTPWITTLRITFNPSGNDTVQDCIDIIAESIPRCKDISEIQITCDKKFKPSVNAVNLFKAFSLLTNLRVLVFTLPLDIPNELVFPLLNTHPLHIFKLPLYKISSLGIRMATEALLCAEKLEDVAFNFEESSEQASGLILREIESHLRARSISSTLPWKGEGPYNLVRYSMIESIIVNLNYIKNYTFTETFSLSKTIRTLKITKMTSNEFHIFLKVLEKNNILEVLNIGVIRTTEIYDHFAKVLKHNKSLKSLKLYGVSPLLFKAENTPVQNSIFEALKDNKTLEVLKLKGGALDIAVIVNNIETNKRLHKLSLKDFRVVSKNKKIHLSDLITACKKLTSLSIIHPELPSTLAAEFNLPKQLNAIFNSKAKLVEVMLSKSLMDRALSLDSSGKKAKLPPFDISNKHIQKLSIQNIKMPGEMLKILLMSTICRLRDIRLENVGMDDALASTAADAINYSSTIKNLSFTENVGIGIQGATTIFLSLKNNKGLLSLDLRGINLSKENKRALYMKVLIRTVKICL